MFVPYGFGDIYLNKILMANIDKFGKPVGMDISGVSIYQAMAIPALGMVAGLAIAVFTATANRATTRICRLKARQKKLWSSR